MKSIKKLIEFIILSHEEREIFQTVIGLENIRRVLYLTRVALPISALYFIIFILESGNAVGVAYQWRMAISTCHAFFFISFLIISTLLYYYSFKPARNNHLAKICVNMTIVILLMGGAVLAAADQLVTNNITPYIMTSLMTALIILIPPIQAVIYFLASYAVFYYAHSITQHNREVLISNQINGITATALGLFLALILWRAYLIRTKQGRLIEKQNQELKAALELVNSQKDDIEQLSRIGRDITSSLSIENIIHTIYENVNTLMDASILTIGLYNPETGFLEFPATIERSRLLPPFAVPLSDENRLDSWCFNQQQEVIVNDCSGDCGKYHGRLTTNSGDAPQSLLYLPLWHKDKVMGVISAQSYSKNAYSDYHVNVLRNLAAYSAIALDNAKTYRRVNELLDDLKTTQDKLIIQSKLAALGALTAGIAHEIKNPLNFVNNFAELSSGLLDEFRLELEKMGRKLTEEEIIVIQDIISTLQENAERIKEHGKRADSIVRSMLQHSRGKSGERQLTDINVMLAEDINLAYHGMRAQDSTFNIKIETNLDPSIGKLEVVPQNISRVFLNIISNACYEAHRKKQAVGGNFAPLLSVSSGGIQDGVEVRIRDNGNGVPEAIRDKLFNPFFTTKPAGQGTGLGLSISYDIIVHEHNGQISFITEEGNFTEFIIRLPKSLNRGV